MMRSMISLLAVLSLAHSAVAQVSPELKAKLTDELKFIASIYQNHYAPKGWKETHLGWDLSAELKKAQAKVQSAQSVKDYRSAVVDLLNSTQDYHVGYSFQSTERATLPFQVKTVEGKALLVFIDRTKLSETAFPFQLGDELISMNGVSVADLQKSIIDYIGSNVPGTDLALSDLYITRRSARANAPVPQGPVLLSMLRAGETTPVTHQLVWEYQKEMIPGLFSNKSERKSLSWFQSPKMYSAKAMEFRNLGNSWGVGERKGYLPNLGKRIWESAKDTEFDAYIYKNEDGKLIGVVRIPSYYPDDRDKATKDFVAVMKKMDQLTDGLVIDQLNNPGGSVFYLYALVSMLTDTSLATPKHRMNINPADVQEALTTLETLAAIKTDEQAIAALGETLEGYPNSYQMVVNMRAFSEFIINQWNSGNKLTEPFYVWGVDRINPHPEVQYTKPVVLLINELDFSGGDFFPTILQDNQRVTIVGARTAGAGGYVLEASFPNSFGLTNLSFTGSLAERVNLKPIENLGVTPDIPLALTVKDLRGNFVDYLNVVRKTINEQVK
ncbi:MAG: protease-like activity factor CPAF [Proteobacteria bacterium]|nr:protease-like activity factor CPAF [Pseudomonadota bacterium]